MTRTPEGQGAVPPSADPCAPVTPPGSGGISRMARFAAGSRLGRLLVIGGLIALGWLFGAVFGLFGAASSAAGAAPSHSVAGSALPDRFPAAGSAGSLASSAGSAARGRSDGFPTAIDPTSANAEAMAGRTVDGLTSQSKPVLPPPSTVDHAPGDRGLVPQTNGGSPLFGDVARPVVEPRFTKLPAPLAAVVPPVVRTAADDPSFSPD
ncbi:hypothetical protein GCM10009530_74920 [Microbispora corallina]|uniref:Uncharacterized protein n=2 Tax=Microbispora corallina TaxID=83302 RepID=A0ABQ4GBK8_9ACTN|nr:hypothetical protein Mco01_73910 [Microbispora corallina]